MSIRIANKRHIVVIHISGDGGRTWQRFDRGMEVSGYHYTVRGGFLMLRLGFYSAGRAKRAFGTSSSARCDTRRQVQAGSIGSSIPASAFAVV